MTAPPPAAVALAEAALGRAIGLRAQAAMRGRLERCLVEAAAGSDVLDFARRLGGGGDEMQLLCDLVTVQETWFFREEAHFAVLADHLRGECAGRAVTVWSAGCANGQEAYSLAMVLAESPVSSWRVLATDVSTRALARTRAARYDEREVRGLDRTRRARWLRPAAGGYEVVSELRERVEVRHHSLTTEVPPASPGGFAAVFCRNVLIYLQAEEIEALLSGIARHLAPGGLLFLASSDGGAGGPQRAFEVVRRGDAFVYRPRADAGAAARPAPPRRPAPATPVAPVAGRERRAPAARTVVPRAPSPTAALPDVSALLAAGERAAAAGDLAAAARAFRQAAYLAPDHGAAHASLGVVLEACGDAAAAARAFAAARAALGRGGAAAAGDVEGGDRGALESLLAARLRSGG
jgi:chemotaxis methyl-accepting protein methylase